MSNKVSVPGSVELLGLHAGAQAVVDSVLLDLGPEDLFRPTPCVGWDVRDLLSHMLGQNYGLRGAVQGGGRDLSGWRRFDPGNDPAGLIASSAKELVESFARYGLDGSVWMPEIAPSAPLPARVALLAHLLDTVVHGWDIASAIGSDYSVPADLLAVADSVAVRVPVGIERDRPGSAFRAPVGYDGASSLHALLARLGRDPHWSAPFRTAIG